VAAAARRAVAGEGAVGYGQSAGYIIEDAAAVIRGVAGQGAVGDGQRPLVLDAAAVNRTAVLNRQVIDGERSARVYVEDLVRAGAAVDGDALPGAIDRQTVRRDVRDCRERAA